MYASIDPGKRSAALAIWDSRGELRFAQLVENKINSERRVQLWSDLAHQVNRVLRTHIPSAPELILEIPQVYEGPTRADPNDLLDLAGVQGAIAALSEGKVAWCPLPREWKGQLPKEISKKRVDAALSEEEKSRITWPTASLRHNVYDALHMGLVYLKKFGVRLG